MKCNHMLGIYDNDDLPGIGRCVIVRLGNDSHLAEKNDDNFIEFNYCPDCGEPIEKKEQLK